MQHLPIAVPRTTTAGIDLLNIYVYWALRHVCGFEVEVEGRIQREAEKAMAAGVGALIEGGPRNRKQVG